MHMYITNVLLWKMYNTQQKNNSKIHNTYCQFQAANWFPYNAFCPFLSNPLSTANLWLQSINKNSLDMNVGWYFHLTRETKVKQQRPMSCVRNPLTLPHVSNFFAKFVNCFQTLEEYFLNFLCYSECNCCGYDTLVFSLHCIILFHCMKFRESIKK